jgi:hypothetical protein
MELYDPRLPNSTTSPTISWPRMMGQGVSRLPATLCKSLPQIVHPSTLTKISPSFGSGVSTSNISQVFEVE